MTFERKGNYRQANHIILKALDERISSIVIDSRREHSRKILV